MAALAAAPSDRGQAAIIDGRSMQQMTLASNWLEIGAAGALVQRRVGALLRHRSHSV